MPNFWGPKIDKKVINSSTKCLISVKIAILTPHIIPPPLVNIWLIFDLQKYVKWLCTTLEVNPCFQKAHLFCMDLQPAADPYNVVCSLALSPQVSPGLYYYFKGVLHPSTKISIFCLFSPSSRGKLILFMYGCDRCVWFKVKKHYIFSKDLRISHVERFKIFFSLFNLRNHFKINRINSCFYYS